jgi:hypothetical protein
MHRTVLLTLSLACALAQADSGYENLSPDQARTLLSLARDFDAENERPPAAYQACLAPYDAQAKDPAQREQIQDALKIVQGAARRMGYPNYPDISDEYERLRLAKMLGSSGWLKQFRIDLTTCLAR